VIRPAATDADLEAYARVWSEVHPNAPISGDEVRRRLTEWDDGRLYLVAEADEDVVGTGFASRTSTPGRAAALVAVLPAYRRRGMGSALLAASLAHARELGASVASGSLSEADLPWAERRGFEAVEREVEFVLDLTGEEQRPSTREDIEIGELGDRELADAYRVYADGVADMPSPEPLETSLERWRVDALAAPLVLVAREGRRVVGYAQLERRTHDVIGHELTTVARTHRRRGIARALKQAQIAWAAERGYRRLITDTDWANEATRRLNESLGYRPLPPLVWVRKELG
jgi:GNAT superfamily N-acetyltransferase